MNNNTVSPDKSSQKSPKRISRKFPGTSPERLPAMSPRRSPRFSSAKPTFNTDDIEFDKENSSFRVSSSSNGQFSNDLTLPITSSRSRLHTRNSLIPSKSILKASLYDDNNTVIGLMQPPKDMPKPRRARPRVSFAQDYTLHADVSDRVVSPRKPQRKSSLSARFPPSGTRNSVPETLTAPLEGGTKVMDDSSDSESDMELDNSFAGGEVPKTRQPHNPSGTELKDIRKPISPKRLSPKRLSPKRSSPKQLSPKRSSLTPSSLQTLSSISTVPSRLSLYPDLNQTSASALSPRKSLYPDISEINMSFTLPAKQSSSILGSVDSEQTMEFTKPLQLDSEETMEFTRPVRNIQHETMEFKRPLHLENEEEAMEFTRPLRSENEEEAMEFTRPLHSENGEGPMEFTRPLHQKLDPEVTMDFTKPVEFIKTDQEQSMDFTKSVPAKFPSPEHEYTMEFTKPISLEQDREETMEFTKPVSLNTLEINDDEADQSMDFTKPVSLNKQELDDEANETMEFTKPVLVNRQELDDDMEFTMPIDRKQGSKIFPSPKSVSLKRKHMEDDDEEKENHYNSRMSLGGTSYNRVASQYGTSPIKLIDLDDEPTEVIAAETPTKSKRKSSEGSRRSLGSEPKERRRSSIASKRRRSGNPSTPKKTHKSPKGPASSTPVDPLTLDEPHTPSKSPASLLSKIVALTPKRSRNFSSPARMKAYTSPTRTPNRAQNYIYTPLRSVRKPQPINGEKSVGATAGQNISLDDFLKGISVDFMDDFLSTTRSHSSGTFSAASSNESIREPKLEDYVIACQKIPLLELYDFSAQEMKKNIEEAKHLFEQISVETLEENPPVFQKYLQSSASQKHSMQREFMLIKAFARQQAKEVWYLWRTQLTEGVHKALMHNQKILEQDKAVQGKYSISLKKALEAFKQEHHQLKVQLEAARKRKEILSRYNQEELVLQRESIKKISNALKDTEVLLTTKEVENAELEEEISRVEAQKLRLMTEISKTEKITSHYHKIETLEIGKLSGKLI